MAVAAGNTQCQTSGCNGGNGGKSDHDVSLQLGSTILVLHYSLNKNNTIHFDALYIFLITLYDLFSTDTSLVKLQQFILYELLTNIVIAAYQ